MAHTPQTDNLPRLSFETQNARKTAIVIKSSIPIDLYIFADMQHLAPLTALQRRAVRSTGVELRIAVYQRRTSCCTSTSPRRRSSDAPTGARRDSSAPRRRWRCDRTFRHWASPRLGLVWTLDRRRTRFIGRLWRRCWMSCSSANRSVVNLSSHYMSKEGGCK